MSSGFIKFVITLLVLLVVFLPWLIMAALAGLWQGIEWIGAQLWPAVLNGRERGFLSGLWLAGSLMTGGMLYVAFRRRSFSYAAGGALAAVSLLLLSYLNMPLTPEAERRWLVGHQLEQSEWKEATAYSGQQFDELIQSFPGQLDEWRVLNALEKNREKFPPLGYSPQDSEHITKLWTAALQSPQPDTQAEISALSKMKDATLWMPDQAELWLATGLFSLTITPTSGIAPESFGAISQIFQSAIQSNPRDADAWMGWALATLLVGDSELPLYGSPAPRLQQVTNALIVAGQLEKKGQYQPIIHRRLKQFIDALPAKEKRELDILQARATLLVGSAEPFDPAVVELANQNLIPASSGESGRKPVADSSIHIASVAPFSRAGLSTDGVRRVFGKDKDYATTMLSVDVDERGEPVSVLPFVSSGARELDLSAIRLAYSWRFPASNQPQHRFIPFDFVNTELTSSMYLQLMQQHIATLANLVARHDHAGLRQQEALIRRLNGTVWVGKRNFGLKRDEVYELNKMLMPKTLNDDYFTTTINKIDSLVGKYNQSPELLLLLARQQMLYFSYGMRLKSAEKQKAASSGVSNPWAHLLWDARRNFGRAIAMDPKRADAWYGWGLSWADEDPEKLVGALVYAQRLLHQAETSQSTLYSETMSQSERALEFLKLRLLLGMNLQHQRVGWLDILSARVSQNYQDMISTGSGAPSQPAYMSQEQSSQLVEKVAIRPMPFPRSLELQVPEVPQEKKYSAGIVSVSFEQAGITQATRTLPFFPDVGPQAAGEKTVAIDLDVSAQGKPQLVLISSSSGVALYDEAALAAAWTWQFAKQPVGRLQRVTVSFRR